jgi:hypothetical protein
VNGGRFFIKHHAFSLFEGEKQEFPYSENILNRE